MKLISFDIGIKNMAYCIIDISGQYIEIQDWNVLNLMEETNTIEYFCTCRLKTKKEERICNKRAKYKMENMYFCESHAKANKEYMLPKKEYAESSLKKKKVDALLKIGKQHMFFLDNHKRTKAEIVNILSSFYENNTLESLIKKKTVTASETDLISIGKKLKSKLKNILEINNVDLVFIENQISPIASRMKTLQGMLAQYFIMKNSDIQIEFVSSSHKLKQFDKCKQKTSYKENKQQGILFCKQIIDNNSQFEKWRNWIESKKKDDLADSFLQGLFYFFREKNITYADDLKIKIV